MISSSLTSLIAALLLVANGVSSTPVELVERAACNKKDYGPFRLYAAPVDGSDWQQVKLIDLYTPRPTNDTIQALSICPADSCGHLPSYWVLKNKVLSAVYADGQAGYSTVNRPVVADSVVQFVNSDNASISRVCYCLTAPAWYHKWLARISFRKRHRGTVFILLGRRRGLRAHRHLLQGGDGKLEREILHQSPLGDAVHRYYRRAHSRSRGQLSSLYENIIIFLLHGLR